MRIMLPLGVITEIAAGKQIAIPYLDILRLDAYKKCRLPKELGNELDNHEDFARFDPPPSELEGFDCEEAGILLTSMTEGYHLSCVRLWQQLSNHQINEKDRHVLAAAIRAKVEVIVTFNVRHFGPEHLAPWGISAVTPDQFLLSLLGLQPMLVFNRITQIGLTRKIPVAELLLSLRRAGVPKFAETVAASIGAQLGPPGA